MDASTTPWTPAEEAVVATLDRISEEWAAGDADAYASLHADDARYVAFDGTVMRGREEIAQGHRPLFRGIMRGSRLVGDVREVRFPSPDLAIVIQRAGIVMSWQKGRSTASKRRLSTNTTVLRPSVEGSGWEVVSFQNTRYRPWSATLMGRLMTRSARN